MCASMAVYACCVWVCVCVCMGGVGGSVLFSLRHQKGEPSIYQLQLGTAPSLLPRGHSEAHFSEINTPLPQIWGGEAPCGGRRLETPPAIERSASTAATHQFLEPKQLLNTNYKDISPVAKTQSTLVRSLLPVKYPHVFCWGTKCCLNKRIRWRVQWLHKDSCNSHRALFICFPRPSGKSTWIIILSYDSSCFFTPVAPSLLQGSWTRSSMWLILRDALAASRSLASCLSSHIIH